MRASTPSAGELVRKWRRRRRLSQLALALEAGISQRHLSFVETGRAAASREVLLLLADELSIPLRERNALLVAGGFAPAYGERPLDAPDLEAAREAIELILRGHEPYPALAIDRHWTMVSANRAVSYIVDVTDPALLEPPVNVLRLSLHPHGIAPRIRNYHQWRAQVLHRLERQAGDWPDPVLLRLLEELADYPPPAGAAREPPRDRYPIESIAVPFELETEGGRLSFLTTTTIFGTALDVLLSELAVESFFPADGQTAEALRRLAESAPEPETVAATRPREPGSATVGGDRGTASRA